MTTFGHTRRHGSRKTYGTIRGLSVSGSQNLQHRIPTGVDIGIYHLRMILLVRPDDEAIVSMHVFRLVHRMIARTKSPCSIMPLVGSVTQMLGLILGSRRQGEVHEMGDGSLTLARIYRLHGGNLRSSIVVEEFSPLLRLVRLLHIHRLRTT